MTADDHVKKSHALERAKDAVNAAWNDGYRAGIAAMQERFAKDWAPGCIYSVETARTFALKCAEQALDGGER